MQPNEISPADAFSHLNNPDSCFLDMRDRNSHESAHIPNSHHLTDQSVQEILDSTPLDSTVIVYCYHGNSSLMAAAWLKEQGYSRVFSMSGGFKSWRSIHSEHIATSK